jgi:hypothetical protein
MVFPLNDNFRIQEVDGSEQASPLPQRIVEPCGDRDYAKACTNFTSHLCLAFNSTRIQNFVRLFQIINAHICRCDGE